MTDLKEKSATLWLLFLTVVLVGGFVAAVVSDPRGGSLALLVILVVVLTGWSLVTLIEAKR